MGDNPTVPQEVLDTAGYDGELDLDTIRENPDALRIVNLEDEKFLELTQSVRAKGVITPIIVRELKEEDNKFFGLIEGAHRFAAAKMVGLKSIPARIIPMSDAEVWQIQLISNLQRVPTKKLEYAKSLLRIIAVNPNLSVAELAVQMGFSVTWLYQQLSLTKLHPQVAELVDANQIKVVNAYALSKLPPDEQLAFVDQAQTSSQEDFAIAVRARAKEIQDARREGRKEGPPEYVHKPRLRKVSELEEMLHDTEAIKILMNACGAKKPLDACILGLNYAMKSDEITKKELEEEFSKKQEKRVIDNKARAALREEAKSKKADETAAEQRAKAEKAKADIG